MIGFGERGNSRGLRRGGTASAVIVASLVTLTAIAPSCNRGGSSAGDGGSGAGGSGAAGGGGGGANGVGGGAGAGGAAAGGAAGTGDTGGSGGGGGGTSGARGGSGGGGGAGGTGGAGGSGGAGGTGGAGGGAGAVDYTSWTFCGRDGGDRPEVRQCLCSAANQCTAHYGEIYLGLGSEMFRVCGVRDGQCTVAAFREREGAGQGYACSLPLGSNSCTNEQLSFDQIASRCTPTFQCNILIGNCPTNFTACPP